MNKKLIFPFLGFLAGIIIFNLLYKNVFIIRHNMENTFKSDVDFLGKYTDVLVLESDNGMSQVAVVPAYQGRVMTSTVGGSNGRSNGWINYALIESQKPQEKIHVYGGEDRFWIGPEGGQYSIFFKNGDAFDFMHWRTPALIDTEPFILTSKSRNMAEFTKSAHLVNYLNTGFDFTISRKIKVLNHAEVYDLLSLEIPDGLSFTGFQSQNRITNTGKIQWKKEKGLLSIWILGMLKPSDHTVIIIPFKPLKDASSMIRDNYFGKVPPDRLVVKDSILYFKGDGKSRGKIGVPPAICKPLMGSYDTQNNLLTIVHFDFNEDTEYVNSLWQIQDEPYDGDVANSYNDGPLDDGSQLGPFYELESSSPAKELKPGESINHTHSTVHFEGTRDQMNDILLELFSIDTDEIERIF